MWKQTELAYLAGIIDGEGTIYIQKVNRKTFFDYFPRIQIVTTTPNLMYWIRDTFGGIVTCRDRSTENRNWKPQYTWYTTRKIMDQLLPLLHPYLIVKKKQVEVMIEFRKTFTQKESKKISHDIFEFRDECMIKIRHFNNH